MKFIVVLVAMTGVVKGLPQYNYPRPGLGNGYNYDRPGPGSLPTNGDKETGDQQPVSGGEDNTIPSREISNEEEVGTEDQEPIIHKHIYVHAAPPELDEPVVPKKPKAARTEKHYKIIFIKAPTPASPASFNVPAEPTREEKTIVYVLVKKPEDAQEITVPSPKPTEPSKPEVYFIRYKATSKKEDGKEEGKEESPTVQDTESETSSPDEENPASPSYLPPSNRLRSAPDYNFQDYDSLF